MLTGPVTILNWSFVRDDMPRSVACRQIALAIRDEVADLEKAGAAMIQIDEAALREGLPLRAPSGGLSRLGGGMLPAVRRRRRATRRRSTPTCATRSSTTSSTRSRAMDADVISIETSRSKMELLDAFKTYRYPNEIGPGVYDIHSPRVPEVEEMTEPADARARSAFPTQQLWINPDCGLKTRKWDEVRPALVNMVAAAKQVRAGA